MITKRLSMREDTIMLLWMANIDPHVWLMIASFYFYISEFKNNANPKNLKEILKQEYWGNSFFSLFVRQKSN